MIERKKALTIDDQKCRENTEMSKMQTYDEVDVLAALEPVVIVHHVLRGLRDEVELEFAFVFVARLVEAFGMGHSRRN